MPDSSFLPDLTDPFAPGSEPPDEGINPRDPPPQLMPG